MSSSNQIYKTSNWSRNFSALFFAMIWWNASMQLFLFLRFTGSIDKDLDKLASKALVNLHNDIFTTTVYITAFAFFTWIFKYYLFKHIGKRVSFFFGFILKTFAFLFNFSLVALLAYGFKYGFSELSNVDKISRLSEPFFNNSVTLFFFATGLITSLSLDIVTAISHTLGSHTFWALFIGKYRRPKERKRIFLFLDLVSSTTIAENLGHKPYSRFIQECFRGIGNCLAQTGGHVYQYVGDEAVIVWKANKRNRKRAAMFYYIFMDKIDIQEENFKRKYDIVPEFSGALHSGKVMISEVGDIKREIAYHGDVLNTTARIQKLCKKYKQPLLATESFVEKLKPSRRYPFLLKKLGKATLSGKSESVTIFSINLDKND